MTHTLDIPVDVTLSRDEILLIAALFERDGLIGLAADPIETQITPAGRGLMLVAAERSLRARGFARLRERDASLEVRRDVLGAVGLCAFATRAAVVTGIDAQGSVAREAVYAAEGQFVCQSSPQPALYRLQTGRSLAEASATLTAALGLPTGVAGAVGPVCGLAAEALRTAREGAERGDASAARLALTAAGMPEAEAAALVALWGQPYRFVGVHRLVAQPTGEAQASAITYLFGQASLWRMVENAQGAVQLCQVSAGAVQAEVAALLGA